MPLAYILLIIFLTSCSYNPYNIRYPIQEQPRISAMVLQITDGDTILVVTQNTQTIYFDANQTIKPFETNEVRFLFIDTPESGENPRLERKILSMRKKEKYGYKKNIVVIGKMATKNLESFLKIGQTVDIEFSGKTIKDKYNRFLCMVYSRETNLNFLQVYNGFAKVYFLADNNTASVKYYKKIFQNAENSAKLRKAGILENVFVVLMISKRIA